MDITSSFGNVVSANEPMAIKNDVFYQYDAWNSTAKAGSSNWSLYAGILYFQASRNWSGSTSNPSGRGGDTTHGKQIGVNYIIKY